MSIGLSLGRFFLALPFQSEMGGIVWDPKIVSEDVTNRYECIVSPHFREFVVADFGVHAVGVTNNFQVAICGHERGKFVCAYDAKGLPSVFGQCGGAETIMQIVLV